MKRTARIYLNSISMESPWYVDYKYVIFSLAQIRVYILRGMKRDRTIASDYKLHINYFCALENTCNFYLDNRFVCS